LSPTDRGDLRSVNRHGWIYRLSKRVAIFSAVLIFISTGVCLLMYLSLGSYIYFPDKEITATPGNFGLDFENIRIGTEDGQELGAWWIPAEHARGALVFCHGNAGNISNRIGKADYFHRNGISVLLYDYRGYGTSTGKPDERGTYQDMRAVLRYLSENKEIPPAKTVYYGESLGGAVAIEAATEKTPAGLILESSFTNLKDMASYHYPLLPAGLIVGHMYDSISRVEKIQCLKLFMHSPDDEVVPYGIGLDLFEHASEPKMFAMLEGRHNDGGIEVSPLAQKSVEFFLRRVLGPVKTVNENEHLREPAAMLREQ